VLVDPARGTPAGRCLRLALRLLISSVPRVATAGADGGCSNSLRSGGAGASDWRPGC